MRHFKIKWLVIALLGLMLGRVGQGVYAQGAPTSTPAPINLATAAGAEQVLPTQTRTATPDPSIQLQVRDCPADCGVNVRAQPSTEAARLGQIQPGEQFVVIGRYELWYQFQYDPSPNGLGWVYGDLVEIIGDASLIPILDLSAAPTIDPVSLASTATQESITLTPGGALTATAIIQAQNAASGIQAITPPGLLPTFTYPSNLIATAPGVQPTATEIATVQAPPVTPLPNGVPPLVPIVALLGLGVLGLLVNKVRR